MTVVRRQVVVPNEQGLHARPIALIAAVASRHRARLRIRHGDREADGSSVIDLMTLVAPRGATLELCAEGEDAAALVAEVAALVESGFGEEG